MEIGSLIKAFNYSLNLTGKLSLSGEFSGTRIDADDFRRHWQGQAQLQMADTRTEGLNFQQLAAGRGAQHQRAGAGKLRQCHPPDSVSSRLTLDNGLVTLNRLQGQSDVMAMTGEGQLDLQKENCDMRFNVRVLGGWKGGQAYRPPETDRYPAAHLRRVAVAELQSAGRSDPAQTAAG